MPAPKTETRPSRKSSNIAFAWLLHLRWGAVFAQVILASAVFFFSEITLPFPLLALIFGFGAASNIYFSFLSRKTTNIDDRLFSLVMGLDIILLTLLLHLTGGPMNPFTFLYLVHIALGSLLMQPAWSFGLALFTVASYAALFFLPAYRPTDIPVCHLPSASAILTDDPLRLHLQGMWVAFTITVFFVVFFTGKIQRALRKNQEILATLEKERSQSEKLASLATLSAGAAHEFSTPLSTIAVAAGEMLHFLRKNNIGGDLYDDALLIRDQVKRCKDILYQMTADAGEHLGEPLEIITLAGALEYAVSHFREDERKRIIIDNQTPQFPIQIQKRTFGRMVRNIIKNGLDASPESAPVQVVCGMEPEALKIIVRDSGCGMTGEERAKACEPFYTTKEPGRGLGLGLYLAKSAMERFGGRLDLDSKPGAGTAVTLTFPLAKLMVSGG